MPPPGENDRPQWHTSRTSAPVFVSVCLHSSPTVVPCGTSLNSRATRMPPGSPSGLVRVAEPSGASPAVHSPAHAFGCGATVSSGP